MSRAILNNVVRTEKTLAERGLPEGSFFAVFFEDGSGLLEHSVNWSTISERRVIRCLGADRAVNVCTLRIMIISAVHEGLYSEITLEAGEEAYQGIRSETLISGGERRNRVLGRFIGKIRDGEIIEEHFLNGLTQTIEGFKK